MYLMTKLICMPLSVLWRGPTHQKVTVSEPEVSGYMMNKHVTYLIRTEPYGYVVRRRFSDFCW